MEYISYCGLLCNECPIFIATINNDIVMKEKLAIEYSNEHCSFDKFDMNCNGCFSESVENSKMCGNCEIRLCGKEKNVKNCGSCRNYPCDLIEKYVPVEYDNRKRLDDIHLQVY